VIEVGDSKTSETSTMKILHPYESRDNDSLPPNRLDERQQLFNEGDRGKVTAIQVSHERISKLGGILFDLDPKHYGESSLLPDVPADPHEFYAAVVRPWLQRHPLLECAEVRHTGTGVHALLWFDEPLAIRGDEDRKRWTGIVKTVQAVLPIDPDQPDITALTRPPGSINSKNGREVTVIREGKPVAVEQVLALFEDMSKKPFATVMNVLTGTTELEPCPICEKEGARLDALDWVGKCYGSCGTVKLEQLYDVVYVPRDSGRKEAAGDDSNSE
jgi:hypothetical protein